MKAGKITGFDFFLLSLLLLAGISVYFTFFRPVKFSNLINREGVSKIAEVEIIVPEDLAWIRGTIPAGEETRNVYGELEWKVVGFEEAALAGKVWLIAKVKVRAVEYSSGIVKYGKYTLLPGSKIYLIDDRYFIEGRVYRYRLLDEKVPF
ncbi:MAG: hypothetical protein HY714_06470 [Candidatus Omnitrophica bacterium]|nr:hypothetical protein [Candidatus Omnitrophota bacterium]